jgi:hypothetical protein
MKGLTVMKPNRKIFDLWKAINIMRDKNKTLFMKELWLSSMGLTFDDVDYFTETFMKFNPQTKHRIIKHKKNTDLN